MKISPTKLWKKVGFSGLIVIALFGNLLYMNIRPSDPILTGWEEYNASRFEELMVREAPVLVEVYASWCPTCLLQHKAFETLAANGNAPTIRAVRVDFEKDADFVKKHHILGTGSLLIFKNGIEIDRAAGLMTADKIANFLAKHQP